MRKTERIPVNDPVIERIETLLRENNLSQQQLLKYLGLSTTAFTRWKYDNGKSYVKYIDQIAKFLGTTSYYLLNGTEYKEMKLNDRELTMLDLFRNASEDMQAAIMATLRASNKI
ncbi:MAG: hypothetical protein LKE85_16515 [Lachnospiraceae bacterium]|jgi:transcriptional regulator with XRE-family HTH domain|nr:hypothetical protein [Lachnospiraceae bacterium]